MIFHNTVHRAARIEQIQKARKTLEKLLILLQSAPVERDRFVSHPYQARSIRRTCETAGKSGKQIERCVISSFQIAESMGFKGDFRQWEGLLRVGEYGARRSCVHLSVKKTSKPHGTGSRAYP